MSWETYYNFPVSYRRWCLERTNKEIQDAQKRGEQPRPTKGQHHNDPAVMAALGKHHALAPQKLRRF